MSRIGHIEVYRDLRGEWRWRTRATNGKVTSDSGEGFRTKRACTQNLMLITAVFSKGDVRELEEDA